MHRTRGALSMANLVADLRHMTAQWDASPAGVLIAALPRLPLYPRFRAVCWFRLSSWLWHRGARFLALWCQARSIRSAGVEIHPAAQIGPGLSLVHSVGIVVGHEVVAAENLVLFQGVTLGHDGRRPGQPRIGARVRIGAGAKVLGPVCVGDGASIGANSVVLADVPEGATARGVWK
jgi:serine O-acetyltransferase